MTNAALVAAIITAILVGFLGALCLEQWLWEKHHKAWCLVENRKQNNKHSAIMFEIVHDLVEYEEL